MKSKYHKSEEELLEGCRKNDRDCQEDFYKSHFDMMYGIAMSRIEDKEEALLVVNNAFLRAFKKIELFRGTGSIGAWLRRILFNAIADYYRAQKPESAQLDLLEKVNKLLVLNSNALTDLYYDDLIGMVNQLPETTREVFTLFAIEGFSHTDISEMMGIPEGSSKWQLHQARKILKARLTQNGLLEQKLKLQ